MEVAAIDKPRHRPARHRPESDAGLIRSAAPLSRRGFLLRAATVCGAVGVFAHAPALADPIAPADAGRARSLRFVHTHTGETLSADYFDGSAYDGASLSKVNHLLRDFRNGESHAIDPALLDILFALRVVADHDAPFEVISGYRSPATNAMLHRNSSGVAEHSQHLLGKAIDVRLSGYSTRLLGERARALACGGVGYYANSDFVHIDSGSIRFW